MKSGPAGQLGFGRGTDAGTLCNKVIGSTPKEFDAFVAVEIKKWTRVITEKGIRAE